jgi:hypothetical protein
VRVTGGRATAPEPAPKPTATTTPPPSRMSNELVQALLALAKQRYSNTLLGMWKSVDDSMALSVRSNRNLIAWRNASVVEDGGRFNPPAEMRLDLVIVSCGDSDLGDIFECARVTVNGPKGQRIAPVSYNAGPRNYQNALGARWTVREVLATYNVRDLRDGFTVTFVGKDGAEWDFAVSAEDAENELLLKLDPASASTLSPSASQLPPPQLDLPNSRETRPGRFPPLAAVLQRSEVGGRVRVNGWRRSSFAIPFAATLMFCPVCVRKPLSY